MIPIINPKGEIIAFGGRIIDQGEPKYLNSPETPLFEKGRELFGLPQARQALRETDTAIVTEGYMDVIALAQNGVGNAVATLGTATTPTHIQKLLRQVDRIVFCFDGDRAGRKAAWRALENSLEALVDNKRLAFVFLPAEHDPDSYIREFGPEAFEACVKKAVPLSRQLLEHAGAECDLDSAEGRARMMTQAIPLIAMLPEGALRGLIADELAQVTKASSEDVRRRLQAQLAKAAGGGSGERGGERHGERGAPHASGTSADIDDAPFFGDEPPAFEPDFGEHEPFWDGGGQTDGGRGSRGPQGDRSRGDWKGRGGKGNWRNEGGRWQSRGRATPPRPLPRAATPLDRIAWVLVASSGTWEQLPATAHDILCDQPSPYGPFFRWLDRLLLDQGALEAAELLQGMREADGEPGSTGADAPLSALAERITRLHDFGTGAEHHAADLLSLIRPLELEALREELDMLLQAGELSEAAEARKLELVRLTRDLKLEISQQRPISA